VRARRVSRLEKDARVGMPLLFRRNLVPECAIFCPDGESERMLDC
jgi:hypothetical protein